MAEQPPEQQRHRTFTFSGVYLVAAFLLLWLVQRYVQTVEAPRPVPYSELLQELRAGHVARAQIAQAEIVAELKPAAAPTPGKAPERIRATRLPNVEDTELVKEMVDHGVVVAGLVDQTSWWAPLLYGWIVPMVLLFGVYWIVMRRVGKSSGPLSFGKSSAKVFDLNRAERVTFDDVAGVDEAVAELVEIVSFLKEPQKYTALGARIPKGVLLVGSPGTGKTLLARAVAGQAGVPFFSMSGSEFVEMFVGVGAARMRDLFEQAKLRAPCIVFIDEIDSIGKSRGGVGVMATHDEREQTLNQLLAEMDGFDPNKGVVLMAATNRPEVLDPALLRAGRFDRQVLVDRPDVNGRRAILRVHTRRVRMADSVDLDVVARRTPGMVGADLANAVNEAALAAVRRGGTQVEPQDFEEAIDRIQLGLKKKGRVMNELEKQRVAWHESGHALVALSVEHADPVHRVTIIPRSIGALGATLQLPTEDRYLVTRQELLDRITVMMGGRAAEHLTFGDQSSGAQNDLERATETARQMVCRLGMSERLGAMTLGRPVGLRFLETAIGMGEERNFSEATGQLIDAEVRTIVDDAYTRARGLLEQKRGALQRIAEQLLEKETLERHDLDALL